MLPKKWFLFGLSFLCLTLTLPALGQKAKKDFYELRIYTLKDKSSEALDAYLQQAYLPALHRAGVAKVGVFKTADTAVADQKLYVFIPYRSYEQMFTTAQKLEKDKQLATAAQTFNNMPHNKPPYARYETVLMEAFTGMPGIHTPNLKAKKEDRIYELRSYEAATEKLHLNKVDMFNKGEIQLFERLHFEAIFYGRVLAGAKMPNLMYMTAFENKEERDAHWKTFGSDPEWKKMSADPQYANNFLRADIYLLQPTAYSDL